MSIIQAFYFTKNYQTEFDCKATLNDTKIRLEAVVSFSGAELGKQYWVNWFIRQPDGQDMAPYSEYAIAEPMTTFYLNNPLILDQIGNYTILRVQLSQG